MPLTFEMHPRCSAISPCVDLANVVMRVMCKTSGDFLVDCCNYGFVKKICYPISQWFMNMFPIQIVFWGDTPFSDTGICSSVLLHPCLNLNDDMSVIME